MDLKELYKEIILDHGKNPRNYGICQDFNRDAKGHNPLCGDKVHLYVKLNNHDLIDNISFEGEGCAISLASASILTDVIKGRDAKNTLLIIDDFLNLIKEKSKMRTNSLNDDQITTIMSLSGVKEFPMRVKCATMAWHTLNQALKAKS